MSIEKVNQFVQSDLEIVERRLLERAANLYEFVDQAAQHVIKGGGKRLRPILTLLSARSAGCSGGAMYDLAAAMELIHIASLVHDDVIDESPLRRGQETLNAKFGNKVAVLVGDYMHARVLAVLVACKAGEEVFEAVAEATQSMCEGEVIHAYQAREFELNLDEYLQVIELKTARLMSCSCRIGASLGTTGAKAVEALAAYGHAVGMAFQIVDDVLDMIGEESAFGKPTRNDLREGKMTLPAMYFRDNCSPEERARLRELMLADERSPEEADWIVQRAEARGASKYALKVAADYTERANECLKALPESGAKKALIHLARGLAVRDR